MLGNTKGHTNSNNWAVINVKLKIKTKATKKTKQILSETEHMTRIPSLNVMLMLILSVSAS